MTDYISSDWAELDANNTNPSPNGIQGGYAPSQVAPILRAMRSAAKRNFARSNPIYTTTGTATAYLLTFESGPTAYETGVIYRVKTHIDNTGAATINVNGLGSKALVSQSGVALTAGQIKAGRILEIVYNGSSFEIISNESHDTKLTGNTSVANLIVKPSASVGGTIIAPGNATYTGFADFIDKDSARIGYAGFGGANTLSLFATAGYAWNFTGGNAPTISGNKIWHQGNDGVGSGLDAGLLAGLPADATAGSNSIVVRDANADIAVRDAVIARNTTSGYLYLTTNKSISFGFDGTYIRTTGADFKVNGAISTTAGIYSGGEVNSATGNIVTQGNSNTHLWYKTAAGTPRAVAYHSPTAEQYLVQLYNTSGTSVRAFSYTQSDGLFYVNGRIGTNGDIRAGSAIYQTDGNVVFAGGMTGVAASLFDALNDRIKNDGGTKNISISGNAGTASAAAISATLRQSGTGSGMTFNWSGQPGQPSWMWGGDAPANMYVYNPSNFSVSYANTSGTANNLTTAGFRTVSGGMVVGDIGTYVFLKSAVNANPGDIIAGSNLNWAIGITGTGSTVHPGSFRSCQFINTTAAGSVGLFLKIT
jgi:hypothetical protein